MQNSIASGAIRISLFQTVPGKELNVKADLQRALRLQKINSYVFFKALGTFDIVLIYITRDFDRSIGQFGPISSILKSNHLLCYSYRSQTAKALLQSLKTSKLMGLSMLKVDPLTQRTYPWIERGLRVHMAEQKKNWLLMGSIGWNEIAMIVAMDNINGIVKDLVEISAIGLGAKNVPVLAKTLSFVCLNYDFMPAPDVLESGLQPTKDHFTRHAFLSDHKVGRKGVPSVEIVTKPIYADSIKQYFVREGFKRGYDLLGKCDMSFQSTPGLTWAECLAVILHFRHHFRDKAFSTSTRLRLERGAKRSPYHEKPWKVDVIPFSYPALEREYGRRVAANLANHLSAFNSLIQNPLYGSAFLDMVDYPKHVLKTGKDLDDTKRLRLAHGAREVLRYGSELRLCGTFQSIEEETGKFSEIQGGGQRALLALEHIPYRVFKRLERTWNGFIVTSQYDKLMHISEVIQIPIYTLWKPENWWTLYHEIAHIWIDVSPEIVSFEVLPIQEFLADKSNPRYWLGKLTELAAEVVGFELGFFDDYALFFKLYWNHILGIDPTQRIMFDFGDYAMRSFFTWLFWRKFGDHQNGGQMTEEEFEDADLLYRRFLEHLDSIEELAGRKLFPDRDFVSAENAAWCSQLYPFASLLAYYVDGYRLRLSREHLDSENTKGAMDNLSKGKIWWEKINCPEAVVYRILQMKTLGFKRSIAAVITFWNQQIAVLKQRAR
jgi:hypothetical protein